jgi:hypothetical protein
MEPEIRPLQFYSRYVVRGTDLVLSVLLVMDCEPLARVPHLARGKISLARGIHCCPNSYYLFITTSVCVLCKICVCVCVCVCLCIYIYTHTHTSNCVQTVYELPLLPNNAAVKHFYTNRERCEVLTGYLSLGRRPGGGWANTWHWTETFTICFPNRKQ